MVKISDKSLLIDRTQGGWAGELSALEFSAEQCSALASLIKIESANLAKFYSRIQALNVAFRQDAQQQIDDASRFGKQKTTKVLRDMTAKAAKQANALFGTLDRFGMDRFAELGDPALELENLRTLYQRLRDDLLAVEVLFARAEFEVAPGRDNTIMQLYLERLADIYEKIVSKPIGISKDKHGEASGPFVRFVKKFFELQPKHLLRAVGINSEQLTKSIRNMKSARSPGCPISKKKK